MSRNRTRLFIAPLMAIFCAAGTNGAKSQEYDFSLHGYFNPSCGGGFFESPEKEGMPFQFDVDLSIDLLLGEPVVRSSANWKPYGFGVSCIEPYNQDGLVRLTNLRQYDPDGKSHPYNMTLVGEISGPDVQDQTFLGFNPGALSAKAGETGYNTSGSPNWDRLFFRMPNGSYDFWNEDLYQYLDAEAAQEIFKSGFAVTDLTVAEVDFDLSEAKSNFGARGTQANTLKAVANRLASWGQDRFTPYPKEVAQRIENAAALPIPKNVAALRGTIDDIKALHRHLVRGSGQENVQVAMKAVHADLDTILDAVDDPALKEEFWQVLLDPVTQAANAERAAIAAAIQVRAQETTEKSETTTVVENTPTPSIETEIDYKYEAESLATALETVAKDGIFETSCGKAGYKVHESAVDGTTGENMFSVGHTAPVCESGQYTERMSKFSFLVSDITAYDISGYELKIEFAGSGVTEQYYATDYRKTRAVQRSDFVVLLNLKHKRGMERLVKTLDELIAYRAE